MAHHLHGDKLTILLELGVTHIELKMIEDQYPGKVHRQLFEALVLWRQRTRKPLKKLLNVFKQNERVGLTDLIRELQGKTCSRLNLMNLKR